MILKTCLHIGLVYLEKFNKLFLIIGLSFKNYDNIYIYIYIYIYILLFDEVRNNFRLNLGFSFPLD